jgi:hypothetical protein
MFNIVYGELFIEIFLAFLMSFGGYLIISIALDVNFNLSPKKLLLALILGSIIMISEAVYFIIFRWQKIVFFFECMLFYDELIISSDLEKAAIEYSKPIETTHIAFAPDRPMHAERSASSIFRLIKGRVDTSHTVYALPSKQSALAKIHKKIVSFAQLKITNGSKLAWTFRVVLSVRARC